LLCFETLYDEEYIKSKEKQQYQFEPIINNTWAELSQFYNRKRVSYEAATKYEDDRKVLIKEQGSTNYADGENSSFNTKIAPNLPFTLGLLPGTYLKSKVDL